MICSECGYTNEEKAKFCYKCGAKLEKRDKKPSTKIEKIRPSKKGKGSNSSIILLIVLGIIVVIGLGAAAAFLLLGSSIDLGSIEDIGNIGQNNVGQISPSTGFPVSKAPDLAAEISKANGNIESVQFQGFTLDKNQCLYILAKSIVMIDNGESGNIPIKEFSDASDPYGDLDSAAITKDEYVDMAGRTYNWMDSNGRAPNHTGIASSGDPDLSTDMTLKLYANVLTKYKNTGQLISPVEVP